jgi:hypothetical protein
MAVEIIRFKGQFLRLGYAIGGITKKSMSLGYGRKLGPLHLDIGMALNGGFSIETARGPSQYLSEADLIFSRNLGSYFF